MKILEKTQFVHLANLRTYGIDIYALVKEKPNTWFIDMDRDLASELDAIIHRVDATPPKWSVSNIVWQGKGGAE